MWKKWKKKKRMSVLEEKFYNDTIEVIYLRNDQLKIGLNQLLVCLSLILESGKYKSVAIGVYSLLMDENHLSL